MNKNELTPSQVTYQEEYKVECPHAPCTKGTVTVTITRVRGGGVTEIKVKHEGQH